MCRPCAGCWILKSLQPPILQMPGQGLGPKVTWLVCRPQHLPSSYDTVSYILCGTKTLIGISDHSENPRVSLPETVLPVVLGFSDIKPTPQIAVGKD